MPGKLNIEKWNRKEHFEFFNSFEEPLYGITTEVDCTSAYERAREKGNSFFLTYLHKALQAANQTESFRYRVQGNEVLIFNEVHASPTVGRDDGTFGYSFFPWHPDFKDFSRTAKQEIERVRKMAGLNLNRNEQRLDVIHFSSLPWFPFTGLSHPRDFRGRDSVPKITFGKWSLKAGRKMLPVAVHVHHGLADGYHISLFLKAFQELLNS